MRGPGWRGSMAAVWLGLSLACAGAADPDDVQVVRYVDDAPVARDAGRPWVVPVGASVYLEVHGRPRPLLGCRLSLSSPESVRVAVRRVQVAEGDARISEPRVDVGGIGVAFDAMEAGPVTLELATARGSIRQSLSVR